MNFRQRSVANTFFYELSEHQHTPDNCFAKRNVQRMPLLHTMRRSTILLLFENCVIHLQGIESNLCNICTQQYLGPIDTASRSSTKVGFYFLAYCFIFLSVATHKNTTFQICPAHTSFNGSRLVLIVRPHRYVLEFLVLHASSASATAFCGKIFKSGQLDKG